MSTIKSIQYTIRGVEPELDRYLRKRAELTGKSLNSVIIDELKEQSGITRTPSLLAELAWFIGSGELEPDVMRSINQERTEQKELMAQEMGLDSK